MGGPVVAGLSAAGVLDPTAGASTLPYDLADDTAPAEPGTFTALSSAASATLANPPPPLGDSVEEGPGSPGTSDQSDNAGFGDPGGQDASADSSGQAAPGDDFSAAVSSVEDDGRDVTISFQDGGSVILDGLGIGSIDSVNALLDEIGQNAIAFAKPVVHQLDVVPVFTDRGHAGILVIDPIQFEAAGKGLDQNLPHEDVIVLVALDQKNVQGFGHGGIESVYSSGNVTIPSQ